MQSWILMADDPGEGASGEVPVTLVGKRLRAPQQADRDIAVEGPATIRV
jgi:hypothetical protein